MAERTARQIAPAQGKLGVLCVGLGAVATTFIAGVENIRRGSARPIGSVTQMGTIRLGKRTEKRAPLIREFVPLAGLDDLVFGAWDPVPDDAHAAALHAGVLDKHEHIEPIAAFLKGIKPMPAVFDQNYVKRLEGKNVKPGNSKREQAEALRKDIRSVRSRGAGSRRRASTATVCRSMSGVKCSVSIGVVPRASRYTVCHLPRALPYPCFPSSRKGRGASSTRIVSRCVPPNLTRGVSSKENGV